MSLYNMLFGVNQAAPVLLAVLGISHNDVPRFRDCYLTDGKIAIHTRTGGGNRYAYESEQECRQNYPEYFEGDEPKTGPYNEDLRKIQCFMYDEDDDFDSTYATFYYSFPEKYKADLEALEKRVGDYSPSEAWQELFKSLEKPEAE